MDSVVVKTIEDLNNVTSITREIEFIEFDLFQLDNNYLNTLTLDSLSFTNMEVNLKLLNKNIKQLSFYNATLLNVELLSNFANVRILEITNVTFDIKNILSMQFLEKLNLNYSQISNCDYLKNFINLEELSIIDTDFDIKCLLDIVNLKTLIIDEKILENNRDIISDLYKQGVYIKNIFGGSIDVL